RRYQESSLELQELWMSINEVSDRVIGRLQVARVRPKAKTEANRRRNEAIRIESKKYGGSKSVRQLAKAHGLLIGRWLSLCIRRVREWQVGGAPQCPEEGRGVLEFDQPVETLPVQGVDVWRDVVGQLAVLQPPPDRLDRVQVRAVRGQPFQPQPPIPFEERPDDRALVVGPPVPDDDHLPPQRPEQVTHDGHDLGRGY